MAAASNSQPTALFAFPDHADLGQRVADKLGWPLHAVHVRRFPDGESLVRVSSEPWNGRVVLLCGLHEPNQGLIECVLAAETLRERGATHITLVAPYLCYMRQDEAFHPGEAVSQRIVGDLLGRHVDQLFTIDAHLHRTPSLDRVFGIPCANLTASGEIGRHVQVLDAPIVVGPDAESAQWVKAVASVADCPWVVGEKTRLGDRDVRYALEDPEQVRGRTVVLVDDIVSTGNTILETVKHLSPHAPKDIHLYAVHGLFVEGAADRIRAAGVCQIVATNTIPRTYSEAAQATNQLDVTDVIATALADLDATPGTA